mmetsp:Transcript_78856/g.189271  ORF Transcript_78856/g.189271 Transcript_78856/m.189271 type:complete len:217 (+) Transcript_78856:572-1222(+)
MSSAARSLLGIEVHPGWGALTVHRVLLDAVRPPQQARLFHLLVSLPIRDEAVNVAPQDLHRVRDQEHVPVLNTQRLFAGGVEKQLGARRQMHTQGLHRVELDRLEALISRGEVQSQEPPLAALKLLLELRGLSDVSHLLQLNQVLPRRDRSGGESRELLGQQGAVLQLPQVRVLDVLLDILLTQRVRLLRDLLFRGIAQLDAPGAKEIELRHCIAQ